MALEMPRQLRSLEKENARLKKLVAKQTLDGVNSCISIVINDKVFIYR
jgi:hypothetical protein